MFATKILQVLLLETIEHFALREDRDWNFSFLVVDKYLLTNATGFLLLGTVAFLLFGGNAISSFIVKITNQ
jgi:hypothetical protein